ncbi:MAG TPA: hypothetical protein VJO16_17645 [Candidatus Acidoferrum sp.]|nr:hypothetical protein [Candidatus Acidoferrum sp.]
MRDWEAIVEQHLKGIALDPVEYAEVIAELAAHLAESCEELCKQGMAEEEAVQRTLSQVEDWGKLRRLIQNARTREKVMTNRVKQFWFPALVTLLLSMGLLMLIQLFGPSPWVIARKSAWSLIAPVTVVYLPWVFSLPLVGALGAYLSNRAGGSRRAILFSIVFPVLPYLAFFLVALPVTAILNDRLGHSIMLLALFVGLLAWAVAPAAALLAGGLLAQFFFSRRLDARRIAGS